MWELNYFQLDIGGTTRVGLDRINNMKSNRPGNEKDAKKSKKTKGKNRSGSGLVWDQIGATHL